MIAAAFEKPTPTANVEYLLVLKLSFCWLVTGRQFGEGDNAPNKRWSHPLGSGGEGPRSRWCRCFGEQEISAGNKPSGTGGVAEQQCRSHAWAVSRGIWGK